MTHMSKELQELQELVNYEIKKSCRLCNNINNNVLYIEGLMQHN
jgi:hypothetical protein